MTTAPSAAHDLLPAELASQVPPFYSAEHDDDPVAHVKWFTPDSSFTWYVVEYDPVERLAFGLVVGHERELGYFSRDEIEQLRGPLGLRVERDLAWQPTSLSECR